MSIRSKLFSTYLAAALLPLLFLGGLTYYNYRDSLESARLSQLQAITAYKSEQIASLFSVLNADIRIGQSFYNIRTNLPVLSARAGTPAAPEFLAAQKMLDGQLRPMERVKGLYNIYLADARGKVVYASNPARWKKRFPNRLPDPAQRAFEEGKKGVYFSEPFFSDTEADKPVLLVSAPIADFRGAFAGVLAFSVDMAPVYGLIKNATGLGRTGETIIAKKEGDDVLFLNALRDEPGAALKRRLRLGDRAGKPIQEAVLGGTGSGRMKDYRGVEVIAAWQYVPAAGWGVEAKIDAAEAFAEAREIGRLVAAITAVLFFLCGLAAFFMARSFSGPINELSRGAMIIGGGNLDHKVGTARTDEIGQLSRAFDAMTGELKKTTASRDELNEEIAVRKKAEAELKQSNESLEQFAYVASHDLQEPLRLMSGYTELLKRRYTGKLDADADEFIDYIADGAARLQRLIKDLLAYSRIGRAGKAGTKVDCGAVLALALGGLRAAIEESGAVVTSGPLPALTGDESDFVRLFQNLIGNAIKFRGAAPPRVHIGAGKKSGEWLFSVKDNGIGIEAQYKDRIFVIFQRLHARNEYPGTGIGLSICKKIVETRGGRIWLESEPGKGSTFYFTFPQREGLEMPGERAAAPAGAL